MQSIYDVFISYRRHEADGTSQGTHIAVALFEYLESKGLRVFLDRERMDNGPFPAQLQWQITHAPNYIFIATNAAMHFRPVIPPDTDYVAEEVRLALKLYDSFPEDRVILPVIPYNVSIPNESDKSYPPEIHRLLRFNAPPQLSDDFDDESFKDIYTRVTKVNRGNLWNAGSRWLEQMTSAGRRFASLNIDHSIIPLAGMDQSQETRLPIYAHLDKAHEAPLMDMIRDIPGHLYLIGEGGIGKTTSLISIMLQAYGPGKNDMDVDRMRLNGQVPLFIELSRAPDTYGRLYEGGRSTFIQRAVYQQIRQDLKVKQVSSAAVQEINRVFNLDPDTAVKPIRDLFTKKEGAPEYLLLLDGLNEVSRTEIGYKTKDGDGTVRTGRSTVVSMVLQEIRMLMEECPNVRVILTSRTKEQTVWTEKTTLLYLSGLKEDIVENYLRSRNLSESQIIVVRHNEMLRKILQIPLFLTLYGAIKGDNKILTRGEILHLFIHQKATDLYTVKNRNEKVDEDVHKTASAEQPNRLTAEMKNFIIDFILPEIGWRMLQYGVLSLSLRDTKKKEGLRSIIMYVLLDRSETAVCGENGCDVYSEYTQGTDARKSTASIAREICVRLKGTAEDDETAKEEITGAILNCAVMTLGILQPVYAEGHGIQYEFIHHHIRDYFAAVYQANKLRMAVFLNDQEESDTAINCLLDWREMPLNEEVRRYIGEILGEAHNAPVCSEDGCWHLPVFGTYSKRSLLSDVLRIFRHIDKDTTGYAVWNLIEILKTVRVDLSGIQLSELNLKGCELNGVCLGRPGCAARFDEAVINSTVFFPHGHTLAINAVNFSPNGKRILTASDDQYVILWDTATCQEISRIELPGTRILSACFSPDEAYILAGGDDCAAVLWDAQSMRPLRTLTGHVDWVKYVCFSTDGNYVVTASRDGTARIWQTATGREIAVLRGHTAAVSCAAFSPDGKMLATVSWDGYVKLWQTDDWQEASSFKAHKSKISTISYSRDGRRMVTASWDKTAILWDTVTHHQTAVLAGHKGIVQSAVFNKEGDRVLTAAEDQTLRLWDTETGLEVGMIRREKGWPLSAVYSPDSSMIAAALTTRTVALWDTDTLIEKKPCNGRTDIITNVSFSRSGNYFVISCADGAARIWDAASLKCIQTLQKDNWQIFDASFSPNGQMVVTASYNSEAIIWDIRTAQPMMTLKGHSQTVSSVEYSPDGALIATSSWDGSVCLWDANSGRFLKTLHVRDGWCFSARFSPDGRLIAIVPDDGTCDIWDVQTAVKTHTLSGHTRAVHWAAFTPDGKSIATASWDRTVKIWDVKSGILKGTLEGHKSEVEHVSFSNDGHFLVSSSKDHSARVWDVVTCSQTAVLDGHRMPVCAAAFHPNGRRIVSVSRDGTSRIWNTDNYTCCAILPNVPGIELQGCDLRKARMELSCDERHVLSLYGAQL